MLDTLRAWKSLNTLKYNYVAIEGPEIYGTLYNIYKWLNASVERKLNWKVSNKIYLTCILVNKKTIIQFMHITKMEIN